MGERKKSLHEHAALEDANEQQFKSLEIKGKILDDDLDSTFGMISLWQYDQKLKNFCCKKSFSTPEIVPFAGGNKKKYH